VVGGGATVNVGNGALENLHIPGKDSNIVASLEE